MPNRPITKLTLYGDSISGNCLKTKWTAEYLDIEHDWVAGPGSLVYETAASTHTFTVVAEGESGHVITLVTVSGDLLFLDDKDNVVALENWKTSLQRYLAYCEQHGLEPRDLTAFN